MPVIEKYRMALGCVLNEFSSRQYSLETQIFKFTFSDFYTERLYRI